MKLVFAGLGVMGAPMASHLAKAGYEVVGFNRSPSKSMAWVKSLQALDQNNLKVSAATDIASAVDGAEALILCVGKDSDVSEVVDQALPHLSPHALIIDHTTTSAHLARDLAKGCAARSVYYCDSPVSGGEAGAQSGQLSLMVGCEADVFDRVTEITKPYTKAITRLGATGSGQLAKMANQIAIAGVVQGLAEALHFTKSSGLDPELVLKAISQGAAGSWQMNNRWPTMSQGQYEFGFAVDWMRKDLGLVLEEARANGAKLEMTELVDGYYAEIQAMGGHRWDTSSLHARLEALRQKP